MCVKNIAPTTYYDGEMPVVTTTNLDKMNKMRGTAREMTEAQRDSNRAPTENLVAVQKRCQLLDHRDVLSPSRRST